MIKIPESFPRNMVLKILLAVGAMGAVWSHFAYYAGRSDERKQNYADIRAAVDVSRKAIKIAKDSLEINAGNTSSYPTTKASSLPKTTAAMRYNRHDANSDYIEKKVREEYNKDSNSMIDRIRAEMKARE